MTTWQEAINAIDDGHHAVQYYTNDDFLGRVVGSFVDEGIWKGEGVVLVCHVSHRDLFEYAIENQTGRSADSLKQTGGLVFVDAEEMLSQIMVNGKPDRKRFERAVRGILPQAGDSARLRLYGELVDILWQRGARQAALELESYWNELLRKRPFLLLCAYSVDPLSTASSDGLFSQICLCHNAVIPFEEPEKFTRAVHDRLDEALGSPLSSMVTTLAATEDRRQIVPPALKYLLWLSRNMPSTAKKVLL